jgi:hypothetical protein
MTDTKAEKFLRKRGVTPTASSHMAKVVSQYRREVLEDEVDRGNFKERGSSGYNAPDGFSENIKTSAGNVLSNYSGFYKSALQGLTSPGSGAGAGLGSFRGSGGTMRQIPEIYSPLWLNSNLNLPRDRATINAWSRAFFALNPVVQNAVSLHSTYPISKLNIKCKDEKIQQFFEEMAEEIDLMNVCVQIAQEYWLLGESFVYAELDERSAKWSRLLIQNPDYMVVKHSVVAGEPVLSLRPDENLKRIVNSNMPSDIQQRHRLDPSIVEHVKKGENIPLSNFYASHIARRISPYEQRGTGLVVSCFRHLMLFDKLRESKFAQADNMVNPLTLVKVGGGGDNYKPTPADLEIWRQVFEEAQYDKDFKIFTHDAVTVERVGHNAGIIDISNDITQLLKEIYIGLMVPQVLMDGGSDVTYANGGVMLDVLRQRYMQFRNMLSNWLRKKIFAPISKINDFYEKKDGEKILVVPEVEWNHMSLFDAGDYIQTLITLTQGEGPAKKVSTQTVYRSLGLSWEDENRKMKVEAIQDAINVKEAAALVNIPLTELRALGPDDIIEEPSQPEAGAEEPLPGEMPGGGGLAELPGLGGGPPPMGGGGGGGPPPGGGGEAGPGPGGPPPGGGEPPPIL